MSKNVLCSFIPKKKWLSNVTRCAGCGRWYDFQQRERVKGLCFSYRKNGRTYYINNVRKILSNV